MPKNYKRVKFAVKRKSRKPKGSSSRYGKSFAKRDKYATLSNSPSPFPASLRPGQGSYSRSAFARASVRSDLEVKNIDFTNTNYTTMAGVATANPLPVADSYITTGGSLVVIPQGSLATNREGRKVVIKGIEQRHLFTLSAAAAATGSTATVRLITVLDRQCNGATPTEGGATGLFVSTTPQPNMQYNLDNAQRFSILSDETFEVNAQASIGANGVSPTKAKVIKMVCNIPIEYSGTTGVLAEIRSNNIFNVILLSGGATATVTCSTTTRCMFVG